MNVNDLSTPAGQHEHYIASGEIPGEPVSGDDVVQRELHFTFEIVTTLSEGDEIGPTVKYVADWLNDNGYGYREIGQPFTEEGFLS